MMTIRQDIPADTELFPIQYADTAILKVLSDCSPSLSWLYDAGPTHTVPPRYLEAIKRLENLGFVFRRNNTTVSLKRQRLKKVLERESRKVTFPYRIEDLVHSQQHQQAFMHLGS